MFYKKNYGIFSANLTNISATVCNNVTSRELIPHLIPLKLGVILAFSLLRNAAVGKLPEVENAV
jgi:hypothetical protein